MATRMAFLTELLGRLRPRQLSRKVPATAPDTSPQAGQALDASATPRGTPANGASARPEVWSVDEARLVFGMRWSPISKEASLRSQLRQARRTRYALHVVSQQGSALGLIGSLSRQKIGAVHSAALVLAEHFSTSGPELFVFEQEGQFALVGLADNNPTPGFDTVGRRDEIEALAEEFMAMNSGQAIRLVGNVDWLPDMADLQPSQLAERTGKRSRLRDIPNPNLTIFLTLLTLLVVAGLGIAYYRLEIVWREQQAAQSAQKDTNVLYEETLTAAMKSVGAGGNASLLLWRDTLKTVPMEVAGWELQSLVCKANKCTAAWKRVSGNFAEFDGNFPYASTQRPKLTPAENNEQSLETEHPVPLQAASAASEPATPANSLQRTTLPNLREAYLQWGSFILDAQLLPQQVASLRPATLFGGEGPLAEIKRPVLKGNWQIESDLWTLKDLRLPPYVVAESLTVSRAAGSGSGSGTSSGLPGGSSNLGALVRKNLGYRYKIEGSFYADGR